MRDYSFSTMLIILLLLMMTACNDTLTVIKGCCEDPAIDTRVGLGRVFVPNVFTPNGDQVNDILVIYGDSMKQIRWITIKNKDNDVVYHNLNLPFNDYGIGWDGSFAGKITRGMYSYVMEVESVDGYVKTIKGKVCNCPCDQPGDEAIEPIKGCEFGGCIPPAIDCDPNEYLTCFE